MQLKEKKSSMERDKRKLESELERQRQKIGKQVFLQVVQKKQQNEISSPQQQQQQPHPLLTQNGLTVSTVMDQQILADRSHLLLSNLNNSSPKSLNSLLKETPRRQWDKTQKGFIDLENDNNSTNINNNNHSNNNSNNNSNSNNRKSLVLNNTNGIGASSTSSMSTPSSSASQSPPLSNGRPNSNNNMNENDSSSSSSNSSSSSKSANNVNDQKTDDLSQVYYKRNEMIKTIEALKSSANAISNSKQLNSSSPNTMAALAAQLGSVPSSSSSVNDIEGELQKANMKLSQLQNEITRLNLMQQKQQTSHKYSNNVNNNNNNNIKSVNGGIIHNGFNLADEKRNDIMSNYIEQQQQQQQYHLNNEEQQKNIDENSNSSFIKNNTDDDSENPTGNFFSALFIAIIRGIKIYLVFRFLKRFKNFFVKLFFLHKFLC